DMPLLELAGIANVEYRNVFACTSWTFLWIDRRRSGKSASRIFPGIKSSFEVSAHILVPDARQPPNGFFFTVRWCNDHQWRCDIDERPDPPRILIVESDVQRIRDVPLFEILRAARIDDQRAGRQRFIEIVNGKRLDVRFEH